MLAIRNLDITQQHPGRSPLTIYAFITLHLIGSSIFTLVLLLTEFVHTSWKDNSNRRHHAWRSFVISWIFFGFSYSIVTCVSLRYGIEGMDKISTSGGFEKVLCMIQAGLIYAAPVLVANTTLGLIVQLRSVMLYGMQRIEKPMSRINRILIAIIPWILWVINLGAILIYGFKNPSLLEMNGLGTYCHLNTPIVSRVMASWLAVVASISVGIEIFLVVLMYKQGFRLAGECDASRTAIRLGIFMLQAIAMVGFAVIFIFKKNRGAAMDIIISCQTPIVAILFGMRTSILCCSARRKQLAKNIEPIGSPTSPTISDQHYYPGGSMGSVLVIGPEPESKKDSNTIN